MKRMLLALLLIISLSATVLAADNLPVFVNALAYYPSSPSSPANGNAGPRTLPNLNIINLSPFTISIGQQNSSDIFLTGSGNSFTPAPVRAITLSGLNGLANNVAYNSVQLALSTPERPWIAPGAGTTGTGAVGSLAVPVTINTGSGNYTIYFTITSSQYLYSGGASNYTPAPLLTSSSINSSYNQPAYGWSSSELIGANGAPNTVQFIGLESGETSWKVATGLGSFLGSATSSGKPIAVPYTMSAAGLVCPKIASESGNYLDLAVIVQSGDLAQLSLIFVAVNTQNDWLLGPATNGGTR